MRKVNISTLTQADLDSMVINARQVFKSCAGATLNSARNNVAKILGARCWASAKEAVLKEDSQEESKNTIWQVKRLYLGNGHNDPFCDTYIGRTAEEAMNQFINDCVDSDLLEELFIDFKNPESKDDNYEDLCEWINDNFSVSSNGNCELYEKLKVWAKAVVEKIEEEGADIEDSINPCDILELPSLAVYSQYISMYEDEEQITLEAIDF